MRFRTSLRAFYRRVVKVPEPCFLEGRRPKEFPAFDNWRRSLLSGIMTSGVERRKFPRIPMIIEIYYQSDSPVIRSRLADLSEGGLFVDTVNPLPPGTEVKFRFHLPGRAAEPPVVGLARVAWNQPMVGMGIEFMRFGEDGWDRLRASLSAGP